MKTSKWMWAFLAVAVVAGVSSAVFLDRLQANEKDGVLVLDNTYNVSVEVRIDDELAVSLEPGESDAYELTAGPDHTIEVTGLDDEVLHENSFALPEAERDMTSKAAYVLGGGRGYALITVRYSDATTPREPAVEPLTIPPGELYVLEDDVVAGVGLSFPAIDFVPEGATFRDRTHLCHYDSNAGTHDCPFSQF